MTTNPHVQLCTYRVRMEVCFYDPAAAGGAKEDKLKIFQCYCKVPEFDSVGGATLANFIMYLLFLY